MTQTRLIAGTLVFLVSIAAAAFGTEPGQPSWEDVRPILDQRCIMCHSSVHGASAGLILDSYEATLAGSSNGPVVIAGDAAGSELVRRLLGESTPRMPFLGPPLPQDEINTIIRWIEAGLPGPAEADPPAPN